MSTIEVIISTKVSAVRLTNFAPLISMVVFLACLMSACATDQASTPKTNSPEVAIETAQPDSILRHAVYFKYTEETTTADIANIEKAFAALPDQIEGIVAFEKGINSSPEGINKGLTHAYLLTFHTSADRDAYLPHPAHKAFGELLTPFLDDVMVIDYWTQP